MDAGTAAVVGAVVGGLIGVLGTLVATGWLARLDRQAEAERERKRHATAVRIATLEIQHNCAALVGMAAGKHSQMSLTGFTAVGLDLFSQLPPDLATDVSYAYAVATTDVHAAEIQDLLLKMMAVVVALRTYGEQQLGIRIPISGSATASEWLRGGTLTAADK